MKKFLLILLSFSLIFPLSSCKKKENLSNISQNLTNYEINLSVNPENKTVAATQTVDYLNSSNSVLKTIKFHLYPQFFEEGGTDYIIPNTKVNNFYPNGISYANFNIDRVKVENTESKVVYKKEMDSILCVNLNNSLMPNERIEIYMEYSFTLPNCNHRFGYGENTINLANFYPIACVFENNQFNVNNYNANGDPFYSDMANYIVNITTEKNFKIATTGTKINETTNLNNKTTSIKAEIVRDFAIVLSKNFNILSEKHEDILVEYYYFNDKKPDVSLNAGIDSIKTFSDLFGKYPYKNFSIVETDFAHGGMEYPNLVMINTKIENHDDYLNVIVHETAHQWWYSLVGNDEFTYPWLDEALTEFSTVLFYDYNQGYNLNHKQIINSSKENYTLFINVYEEVLGSINTSMRAVDEYETEPEYTYCTYVKGVLMFESLYQLVGKNDFIKSLKTYFENNKFKNATPNDLILAFSSSCKKDLSNFFSSWINGKVVIR